MELGSPSKYVIAVFIAYFMFVFICERLNPFVKPKSYAASSSLIRWRFARTIAIAFLIFTWLGLFAAEVYQFSNVISVGSSTVLFGIFLAIMGGVQMLRRDKVYANSEKNKTEDIGIGLSGKDTMLSKSTPKLTLDSRKQIHKFPAKQSREDVNLKYKKLTNDQQLNMEFAISPMPPDLIDFDQNKPKAEIEFFQSGLRTNQQRRSVPTQENASLQQNNAFESSAMDRKKRRITQVKASKVIMKVRKKNELFETKEPKLLPKNVIALKKPKAVS